VIGGPASPAAGRHEFNRRHQFILDELNKFTWPVVDLHPIPGIPLEFKYEFLPPSLFDRIVNGVVALDAARKYVVQRIEY
jgi:hypothetical protein